MYSKTIAVLWLFTTVSCKDNNAQIPLKAAAALPVVSANENNYASIADIPLPPGFKRAMYGEKSFAYWLEHIVLKKNKTVFLYDGRKKANQSAQFAVLDIPVGNKDLQQCADAVMRLRAMYLYANKEFDSIVFYDNDQVAYRFTAPYTDTHFDAYLQSVFSRCGTASLARQLKRIPYTSIQPGDVLIRGGFPGHAVIVADMATSNTGNKIYLLAQSYMPAQDIHLLVNPAEPRGPWYYATGQYIIDTPEYTFYNNEWMEWQ